MKEEIISVEELLGLRLNIPDYQRPYKWKRKNVAELLGDIDVAIAERRRIGFEGYRYRVGTIILCSAGGGKKGKRGSEFDIVDGQQRILTLAMLKRELEPSAELPVLENSVTDTQAIDNLRDNRQYLHEWVAANKDKAAAFSDALSELLQVVVITVDDVAEAFQLFDSQNTRGKELDPHDLLKAYHLREMDDFQFEKMELIKRWEDIAPSKIRELFSLYLFPIMNWSKKTLSSDFTVQEIDRFKGVDKKSSFTYAQRVARAMPSFQIDQPFCAGADFFLMVEHYIKLLANVQREVDQMPEIKEIIEENKKLTRQSVERRYVLNLFYCCVMFYYDRFHNLDKMVVKKLFAWAMMIRVDMQTLGFDTINNYAIGDQNNSYTNSLPMLFLLANARSDSQIKSLRINVRREPDEARVKAWQPLYEKLKKLMGVE